MSIEFKIRKDFQSIEEEIFKLNEYGKIFHDIRDEYTSFKNQEDFHQIYSLEKELQKTFDELYSSGGKCSFSIYHILENINYFDFYPTLTDLINELEEKFSYITQLETILLRMAGGTGVEGLQGIQKKVRLRRVRWSAAAGPERRMYNLPRII